MNILIADDEKEFVSFIKERLEGQGHQVEVAGDGSQALKLIKTDKYDIVFVDHNMPELTGLELAKYAKEYKVRSKIIMVTGYEQMSGPFAKAVGADEYLTKPVKIKEIEDIIKKYDKTGSAQ